MEIITAGDGTAHVSSADDGTIYAGIAGNECYVTGVGDRLSCTMQGANTAMVGTGVGIMYGRAFRVAMPEEVTIQSGTQSQRRHDVICAHFTTSSEGHESGELVVLKGTPTSGQEAEDPEIPSGDILEGATEAYMPLWRIPFDGINVGEPEAMFDVLMSMSELQGEIAEVRDSVSRTETWSAAGLHASKSGNMVSVQLDSSVTLSDYWSTALVGTLPVGWRPAYEIAAPVSMEEMPTTARMRIGADGRVMVSNSSGTSVPGTRKITASAAFVAA